MRVVVSTYGNGRWFTWRVVFGDPEWIGAAVGGRHPSSVAVLIERQFILLKHSPEGGREYRARRVYDERIGRRSVPPSSAVFQNFIARNLGTDVTELERRNVVEPGTYALTVYDLVPSLLPSAPFRSVRLTKRT